MFTPAFAQAATAAAPTSADILMQLVPFALIFAIAYFFVIRPQRKKAKDHDKLIKNTRRGDSVVTTGGQMVLSAQDLRAEGAVVEHAVCVIDREGGGADVVGAEGIELQALFTMRELEQYRT